MATDLYASFNEQYMNVSAKLKKKFLRKPNVQEVMNEFMALAIQCEHSEQPTFAGHTYIMAAKCENTVGNFLGEAECLLAAARQFMKAEQKLFSLKCLSPSRENLEAAIGCYMQVMSKYPEESPLRTATLLELADELVSLGRASEAVTYYQQAIQAAADERALALKLMCKLMDLHVHLRRYDSALDICNKICEFDPKLLRDNILSEVQINRILLVLIVQPAEAKIPPSLKKLFTDLTQEDDDGESDLFNPDLATKLQSIIICCEASDAEALIAVSADTKRLFTIPQQDLMMHLIRTLENKL